MVKLTSLGNRIGGLPPKVKLAPKVADTFYTSPEWRALRKARMKDADYREARRRAEPGEGVILDHIKERRDGGADLDPKNTQWLTFGEHQRKTADARARRARGGR